MTPEDIFLALKKRWLLILSVTLVCLIDGSIFVLLFGPEPVYQSSTTVLVNYRADQNSQLTQSDLITSQKLVSIYNEIIKSAMILELAIKKLYLDISSEELLKQIMVSQVNDTEIIKISVKDESPALARDIANTIASIFSKEIYGIMKVDSMSTLNIAKLPTVALPQNKVTKIVIAGILGIMVVASHQTESELALRSMKLLETVGAKVLGTVLTKVLADRKGYYGYQYYEYNGEESQKRHKKRKRRLR